MTDDRTEADASADHENRLQNELDFRVGLERLINCHSKENGSDTPDFILAEYLLDCLKAFDRAANERSRWQG